MSSPKGQKKQHTNCKTDRRDFVTLTAGAAGVVGAACAVWPFVDSLNPAKDVQALATTDVDLSSVAPGQALTVMWQGKPVFIRHRTPQEISHVRNEQDSALIDPETDEARFTLRPEWLVVIGICTHLGCVPQGQKMSEPKGNYEGWFCPCHGSEYDLSGRVRKGPAPKNLPVPPYKFVDENTLRIGEKDE